MFAKCNTLGEEETAMATMNISLPDAMRDYVEERIGRGGYSTASEYFRMLVREDQRRKEHEALEALLIEAIESGPSIEATPEFRQRLRAELVARYHVRQEGERA
jgi:antitoxin ParD1/3/4